MTWHNYASGTDDIGRPYQGAVYFWPENEYGTGQTNASHDLTGSCSVSEVVEVARLETGDVNRYFRGLDSIYISKATKTNIDYTFHLEYLLATDDILLDLLVDRTASAGTVQSLSFAVGANKNSATNAAWYWVKGAKCKTVTVEGGEGEPWKVSADFSCSTFSIYRDQAGLNAASTTSSPAALNSRQTTGDICMFNSGGWIQDGSGNTFAYITKSFSVTVNHNLQDLWTVGSRSKTNCIESALDVTGNCDISLDAAGRHHFRDVLACTNQGTIDIRPTALIASPKLYLTDVRWDSSSIDISPGNEGMMESAPFTAEVIAVSQVS